MFIAVTYAGMVMAALLILVMLLRDPDDLPSGVPEILVLAVFACIITSTAAYLTHLITGGV